MKKKLALLIIQFIILILQTEASDKVNENQVIALSENIFHLSEVMLHDVASPPAASRFYAYSLLGAYEVTRIDNSKITDISKKFKDYPDFSQFKTFPGWSKSFCSIYTLLEIGKNIMPSGYMLEKNQIALENSFKKKYRMSAKDVEANKELSISIASKILQYAKEDGYNSLSTYTRYSPKKEEGNWYPTPPAYMEPVEPNWKTIRTFFLDSSNQFIPPAPVPYSTEKNSPFYLLLNNVYQETKQMTQEQKEIAAFWDCNPFAVKYAGHMAIGIKKISPGGHWMGITGIACEQAKVSFDKAILAHALVALSLHDAFISCWDEKFRSDRIRPETAINRLIDKEWKPLLQTPPFPEYTSGHSVISTVSAEILTSLFGDSFKFIDTSEKYFGLRPRTFSSFRAAANEAAISRLYGGIHYQDAIEEGQAQGLQIGQFILNQIKEEVPDSE